MTEEPPYQPQRDSKETEKGNVILKLRMKNPDGEQSLGLFFQKIETHDGRRMVTAKVVPLIYTTEGFTYEWERGKPTWFTENDFTHFLDALSTLAEGGSS
jgi:hypothetical protein